MKHRYILASILALGLSVGAQAQLQNFSVGDIAPDFTVTDAHGNSHNLYAHTGAGQYVILDFFFTTCPPCQQTTPYFSELHEKYGCNQGDLFALSLDIGDNNADVLAFEATYGGTHAAAPAASGLEGGGNAVNSTYSPAAYPTYVLIGPDNKFINIDIWPVSSVASFEAAFPGSSNITPQSCAVAVDPAKDSKVSVVAYPNPATNAVSLQLGFPVAGEATVEVLDLAGALVHSRNLGEVPAGERQANLDVSGLAAGTYIVKVHQDGGQSAITRLNVAH